MSNPTTPRALAPVTPARLEHDTDEITRALRMAAAACEEARIAVESAAEVVRDLEFALSRERRRAA